MSAKMIQRSGFAVAGITARTNNANEISGLGEIGKLWARLYREKILDAIPDKIGSEVLAVYTDYAGDMNGEYTFLLGARVASTLQHLPEGLAARQIPPGNYAIFTSGRGPVQEVVPALWARIWSLSSQELGGQRLYTADYEVYGGHARDPNSALVDVYVAINEP